MGIGSLTPGQCPLTGFLVKAQEPESMCGLDINLLVHLLLLSEKRRMNGWLMTFEVELIFFFSYLFLLFFSPQILSTDHRMWKLSTSVPGSWRCSGSPLVTPWPAATATIWQSSTSMFLTSRNSRQRNSSRLLPTTLCEVFGPSWPSGWGWPSLTQRAKWRVRSWLCRLRRTVSYVGFACLVFVGTQ